MGSKEMAKALFIAVILIFAIALVIKGSTAAEISGKAYDYMLNPIGNVIVSINTTPCQKIVVKNSSYSFSISPGSYLISAKYYENNILKYSAEEKVEIKKNGSYKLDLLLFPDINEEEKLVDESYYNITLIGYSENNNKAGYNSVLKKTIIIAVIGLALLSAYILAAMLMARKKGKARKKETGKGNEKGKLSNSKSQGNGLAKKETAKKRDTLDGNSKENSFNGTADASGNNSFEDELKQRVYAIIIEEKRIRQKDLRKKFPYSEAKISLILSELQEEGKIRKIKKGRGNIVLLK